MTTQAQRNKSICKYYFRYAGRFILWLLVMVPLNLIKGIVDGVFSCKEDFYDFVDKT